MAEIYYTTIYNLIIKGIEELHTQHYKSYYQLPIETFQLIDDQSFHNIHYGKQNSKYWWDRDEPVKYNGVYVFRTLQILTRDLGYCLVDFSNLCLPQMDIRLYNRIPPIVRRWHNFNKIPNLEKLVLNTIDYSDKCVYKCCNPDGINTSEKNEMEIPPSNCSESDDDFIKIETYDDDDEFIEIDAN